MTATSGDFSDGELRPIPILPGRMHLMQSRFVTLKDPGQRVMRFDDLARNDDPTRINEQMVVTLDAQLFYSVLSALPYLVNYPYECTEQTLNRFVSTGILSSLYRQYPAIERMAKEFSSRQTQFEQWDAADPNRKMALEETPWLQMAKGGRRRRLRPDQRARLPHRQGPAGSGAGQAAPVADLQRRIPLVPRRAAVAVHDALSSARIFQSAGIRRRRAARDGAAGLGLHAPALPG